MIRLVVWNSFSVPELLGTCYTQADPHHNELEFISGVRLVLMFARHLRVTYHCSQWAELRAHQLLCAT
jgi:hypothetical protein